MLYVYNKADVTKMSRQNNTTETLTNPQLQIHMLRCNLNSFPETTHPSSTRLLVNWALIAWSSVTVAISNASFWQIIISFNSILILRIYGVCFIALPIWIDNTWLETSFSVAKVLNKINMVTSGAFKTRRKNISELKKPNLTGWEHQAHVEVCMHSWHVCLELQGFWASLSEVWRPPDWAETLKKVTTRQETTRIHFSDILKQKKMRQESVNYKYFAT